MPKENNKMQVDIDTLKKQNVNDLLSIKELYSKLEELGEKITQTKYIDNTIVKKLKKEYENLKKIILDENIQVKLTDDIETINSQIETKANKDDIETINSQMDTNKKQLNSLVVYLEDYRNLVVDGDWTNAINTAISQLPPLNIIQLYNKMGIGGGGKIVFPLGENIKISGEIKVPASTELDLNKSIITCTSPNSCITIKDTTGLYDNNTIGIVNGFIDGNNIALNGLKFYRLTKGYFKNLTIYKCVGDGIALDQCQWNDFQSVYCFINGGYGISLNGINDISAPCANNSFVRCVFEGNTLGGTFLGITINNAFTNCTFQFSIKGYGVHLKGTKNIANIFNSCYFEGNKVHAYIQSDDISNGTLTPRNTNFISPFFVIAPHVERWIINEGENTVIENYSTINNPNDMYVKNGTKAPIEQSKTSGFIKVTGSLPLNINSMYCYSDGVEVVQNDTYNSRFLICEQRYDGWNFSGTFKFDGAGGKNMLKINGYYLWVDSQGKLRIRNRRVEKNDDLLGTIVGSQS